jgi:hypothetical protein
VLAGYLGARAASRRGAPDDDGDGDGTKLLGGSSLGDARRVARAMPPGGRAHSDQGSDAEDAEPWITPLGLGIATRVERAEAVIMDLIEFHGGVRLRGASMPLKLFLFFVFFWR